MSERSVNSRYKNNENHLPGGNQKADLFICNMLAILHGNDGAHDSSTNGIKPFPDLGRQNEQCLPEE